MSRGAGFGILLGAIVTASAALADAPNTTRVLTGSASLSAVQSAVRAARDDAARRIGAERPRARHRQVHRLKPDLR